MKKTDDKDYLPNYKTDHLYISPTEKGGYITLIFESELSKQIRLGLKAFYISDKQDFSTFSLIKMKLINNEWVKEQEVSFSKLDLSKIRDFLNILNGLDLKDISKQRISLNHDINISSIISLLQTENAKEVFKTLTNNASFKNDLIALAHKKRELETFRKLLHEFDTSKSTYIQENSLSKQGEEDIWQHFFENNKWIFGYGLNYIFLDKVGKKLESTTTGQNIERSGKRVDALMKTKAEVSQMVFIELKKPSHPLLDTKEYRPGCWVVSQPIHEAISQVQKTVSEFLKSRTTIRMELKDEHGVRTSDEVYTVTPKSYVIIGRLQQLKNHDDKIECFELYRRSITSPEILTYDELFERAKCIVQTLSEV